MEESVTKITNGTNEPADISKLKLSESRSELETVPINNDSLLDSSERVSRSEQLLEFNYYTIQN